jgi:hypothetical protein
MEQVQIGKPFVIKWQMDPSKKCTVELSVDGGLSYTWLNPAAAVKDSLVWHVDSAIADSTIAMLKVHEYEVFDPFAARTLVLVNHAPEPYQSVRPQRNGFSGLVGGVSSDRSGTIRVSNVGSGVISVFDARGRVVLHAPVRNGIALGNVMERGALVYRLFTDGNVVRSRIVPGCE